MTIFFNTSPASSTAWEIGDRGFKTHSGIQVSKEQNVSSSLTRKDSILRGASISERWPARPQTSSAQCVLRAVSSHHPEEFLMAQFSLHVHKVRIKSHSFYSLQFNRMY